MRTLYVLRHAKSDWGDSSLSDFDRPLNDRGRKAAKAVGKELRKRKIKPDLVLASPAERAIAALRTVGWGWRTGRPRRTESWWASAWRAAQHHRAIGPGRKGAAG